MTTKP